MKYFNTHYLSPATQQPERQVEMNYIFQRKLDSKKLTKLPDTDLSET